MANEPDTDPQGWKEFPKSVAGTLFPRSPEQQQVKVVCGWGEGVLPNISGAVQTLPDELQVITPMAQKINAEKGEYRFGCGVRFDLLDPDFIRGMAHIMHRGAEKYGPDNWKKGLTGENSGINHAVKHCMEYLADEPCDYGEREAHLYQVAVNAMFEAYHAKKARLAKAAK